MGATAGVPPSEADDFDIPFQDISESENTIVSVLKDLHISTTNLNNNGGDDDTPESSSSTADSLKRKRDSLTPANKRGKPNIPEYVESHYRKGRNALARASRASTNAQMFQKYLTHPDPICPQNLRVRNTPPPSVGTMIR